MMAKAWNTLTSRVFAAALFATLAFGLISGVVTRVWMIGELRSRIAEHAHAIGRGMQAQATEAAATQDEVRLQGLLRATLQANPHVRYLLAFDAKGALIGHSLERSPSTPFLQAVAVPRHALEAVSVRTEIGVTHDIAVAPERPGQVEIHVGVAEAWLGDAIRELTILFGAAGAAGLVAGAVAAWAISRRIALPLQTVADAAQAITAQAGKLGQDEWEPPRALPELAQRSGIREVDGLSASFLQMADTLHSASAQLRASRMALARSERMAALGSFVAGTAHAINNPLAGVRACLEMLGEANDLGRTRRYLAVADEGLSRVADLVQRMQQYARAGGTKHQELDLNQLVRDSLAIEALSGGRPDQPQVQVIMASQPAWTLGDAAELLQALEALLTNAVQASPPGGQVTVGVLREPRRVGIQVTDQGPGVALADRERVFEPFFTTKSEGVGTGLGLWVVWGVVERHRGEVCIDDAPGGGARVSIWLPTRPREATDAA
ncbi:MAG: HAMP domain-containing histidine kinase [Deltaproteobacteria bacterium]|nr:HAMP domain-containing histidine kinase [Deltaproteobacteria bacterium]